MKKLILCFLLAAMGVLGICQEPAHKLGSVPKLIPLKTNEACRAHFEEVYEASLYYVSHYNTGLEIETCRTYLIDYAMNSEDMVFSGGPSLDKWLKEMEGASRSFIASLMAGYIIYMHDHPEEDHVKFSENAYIYAFSTLLDYYQSNRKINMAPESKTLDHYIEVFNKSKEDYLTLLRKDYKKAK